MFEKILVWEKVATFENIYSVNDFFLFVNAATRTWWFDYYIEFNLYFGINKLSNVLL